MASLRSLFVRAAAASAMLLAASHRVPPGYAAPEDERGDTTFLERRGIAPPHARQQALARVREWQAANTSIESYQWKPIGPSPVQAFWYKENGRVTEVVVSPVDRNVIIAGTSGGGIWRSTNGGATFAPVSDNQADITVGAIAIAPSNPNVLYAGMGDDHLGTGVLKSTDAGATWHLVTTAAFAPRSAAARILVDPKNENVVWLAQMSALDVNLNTTPLLALLKSTDGGVTWKPSFDGIANDILMVSNDGSTLLAGVARMSRPGTGGIYRTTDGGATWSLVYPQGQPEVPPHYFLAKAGSTIYAIATDAVNDMNRREVIMSTDAGEHWTKVADAPRDIRPLYLAANPYDGTLFYGAIGLYRSSDGGLTWKTIPESVTHLDQHAIAFDPVDPSRVWFGNDGGIWLSEDGGVTLRSLGDKISAVQFYSITAHPTDPNILYAGAQDNGVESRDANGNWKEVIGGDGGWQVFDPPTGRVLTTLNGLIDRIDKNGQASFLTRYSDFGDGNRFSFIAPMVRGNDGTVWFPTYRLFASRDFGATWTAPGGSTDLTSGGTDAIVTLAVSDSDPRTLYTASAAGRVMVTHDGAATWTDITPPSPRRVASIAIDRTSPQIAYLSFTGYSGPRVMRTANFGAKWVDASSGLPAMPVNAVYIDRRDASTLYAGTDVGVFRSRTAGADWAPFDAGMPPVIVTAFTTTADGRLIAATYGRGAFELAELTSPPPSDRRRRSVGH